MPRLWLSGPRLFHGLVRPGISFGREDFRPRTPWRAQLQGGFIYIIKADNGNVKIGVTANPENRLAQIQTGISHRINYAFIAPTSGNAYAIERLAHEMLAQHRISGEWFDVSPELAIAAVAGAAAKLGQSLTTTAGEEKPGIVARCISRKIS